MATVRNRTGLKSECSHFCAIHAPYRTMPSSVLHYFCAVLLFLASLRTGSRLGLGQACRIRVWSRASGTSRERSGDEGVHAPTPTRFDPGFTPRSPKFFYALIGSLFAGLISRRMSHLGNCNNCWVDNVN